MKKLYLENLAESAGGSDEKIRVISSVKFWEKMNYNHKQTVKLCETRIENLGTFHSCSS